MPLADHVSAVAALLELARHRGHFFRRVEIDGAVAEDDLVDVVREAAGHDGRARRGAVPELVAPIQAARSSGGSASQHAAASWRSEPAASEAAHVMPSATSLLAFGVIMSGLCQPTLCQPRSSTTTCRTEWMSTCRRAQRRGGRSASTRCGAGLLWSAGATRAGERAGPHHEDVRLRAEVGDCGRRRQRRHGQQHGGAGCAHHDCARLL